MNNINGNEPEITRYPAEVLQEPARRIEEIDEDIRRLAGRMIDIMLGNKGIGLAGPQISVNLRIFVISLDGSRDSARVYINPIVKACGKLTGSEEGCLSVPGIYTKVRRYSGCTVTASDLEGEQFTEHAEGLYARCLQHEADHLDGITIVNKMSQTAKITNRRQLKKLLEQQQGKNL